jgi:PAS domain S-box-containing protein
VEDLIIQNILESMTDSLLVIGPQGEILYANKATEDILGCDLESLRENGLGVTFFTREENYLFNQFIVDAVQDKSLKTYSEVSYHHPDGSMRRLAATMSYLIDPAGPRDNFVGFMAIYKDITEVYKLRQREKRVAEERRRVAIEKAESLQKLAAGVAHEIRNPTVTIGGFAARLLKLKGVPEEVSNYARKILDGAARLELLVKHVQTYCDITRADLMERSVAEVVRGSIVAVDQAAREKNIGIALLDESSHDMTCHIDPGMLRSALIHLLDNAIDFSPDGSEVDVVVTATSEDVVIEIRDCGTGISPGDEKYLFDPFFSTRPDKSGMGLATVQRIAHEHMGTVSVESLPGRCGTRACLRFPRMPACPVFPP